MISHIYPIPIKLQIFQQSNLRHQQHLHLQSKLINKKIQNLKTMIIIDALITVVPIIALYSQYSLIKQRQHIGSFSIDICGIMILANVLRIMFWFAKGFSINLLVQSFVVIGMSFALLDLCIDVGYQQNNSLTDLSGENQTGFWRWKTIAPFILCTVFFTAFMALFTAFFVYFDISVYGQVIGLVAIAVECCLGFPQLYNNQKAKSVEGLSTFMISTWFCGDFFKTIYFILKNQPMQFIAGGAIQLAIDLLLVIQILAFQENQPTLQYAKQIPEIKDEISNNIQSKNEYQNKIQLVK